MYNRISRPSSIISHNEIYVSRDGESERTENSESSTAIEKTDLMSRTIRRPRANSKVLTPEVLDLCAKEIQQENIFRKRYEQAAMYVYGTSQQHCGLDSTTLASQHPGSVFEMPYLSDPCFTSFGYSR